MIIPLGEFNKDSLRGSIEDRRFLVCLGSSGRFYGLGVFVRTNDCMHVVLLPPDDAEHMDTYRASERQVQEKLQVSVNRFPSCH